MPYPSRETGNNSVLQKVSTPSLDILPYYTMMKTDESARLRRLAGSLRGLKVGHLNATSMGGGVAEILRSLVPLMNDLGLNTHWNCMAPNRDFSRVTKNLHNSLQGSEWQFKSDAHEIFEARNRRMMEEVAVMDMDLWIVHDPQPCPVSEGIDSGGHSIWHCHIDTSSPDPGIWEYLYPYLKRYDRLVFCLPDYTNASLIRDRVRYLWPAIDPLVPKNLWQTPGEARKILSGLGLDPGRPLATQVSRFDPWKDPLGVIDAYRMARREIPGLQLALVGAITMNDDSEAERIFEEVQRYRNGDPDIHLFSDPARIGEEEVNAFQTASEVVLQKSIREGFGISVSEALWKGTPVVAGNCGGIRLQIQDGESGFLVNSIEECAARMVELFQDEGLRNRLGASGREYVSQHNLIPRLLIQYLELIEEVVYGRNRDIFFYGSPERPSATGRPSEEKILEPEDGKTGPGLLGRAGKLFGLKGNA